MYSLNDLVNLSFFPDWVVGFTIAEGSFGHKSDGTAFYQIKPKGLENYVLIKAICLTIAGREAKAIKPDVTDSYQLTLSSKLDVQKVVDFLIGGEIIHCLVINLNNIMYELEGSGKVFAIRALLTFLKEIPGFYSCSSI